MFDHTLFLFSKPNPRSCLLNAWPRASPALVLGGTSADPVSLRPIHVSGLPRWLSVERCAGANARFGPNDRNVLRPSPVLVLVSLLQSFVEVFLSPSRVDHAFRVVSVPPTDIPVVRGCQCRQLAPAFRFRWRPPPSLSMTSSLEKSHKGSASSILNQWCPVCLMHHSLRPTCAVL